MHLTLVCVFVLFFLHEASLLHVTPVKDDSLRWFNKPKVSHGKMPLKQLSYNEIIQNNSEGYRYLVHKYLSREERDLKTYAFSTLSSISVTLKPKFRISQNLTGWTKKSEISLRPTIRSVQISSVIININTEATTKLRREEQFDDPIRLKLVFRAFGSSVEEERDLFISSRRENEEEMGATDVYNFSDDFIVDNLHSDTGYIFCFFLLSPNEHPQNETDGFDRYENEYTDENDPNNSSVSSSPKEDKSSQPFINNEKSFVSSLSIKESFPQPQIPLPKRNYAYTSTGEFIYLPSSSWSPHSRSRRSGRQSKSEYCLESKTLAERRAVLNPLFTLIISLSIIGGLIAVLVSVFVCRSSCFKAKILRVKKKIKMKKDNIDSKGKAETPDLKNSKSFDKNHSKEKTEERKNSCDEKYSEVHQTERRLSISKLHPKCKRSYIKDEKLSVLRKANNPKILSGIHFHPGYDIPPSSTVEAYGYDFPKHCNSKVAENPVSSAPSSCELNEHVSDRLWDHISAIFNLDIPHNCNKHSKINKCINTLENFFQPSELHTLAQETPPLPPLCNERQHPLGLYMKSKRPSYETCQPIKSSRLNYNINPYKTQSLKLEAFDRGVSEKRRNVNGLILVENENLREIKSCSRLGDVTISGGTLIEVPEGYVIPKGSRKLAVPSVIRIKVDGNLVYPTAKR